MTTATKNPPQVDILIKRRSSMHFHGLALTLIVILALALTQPTLTLIPNPDLLQGFSSFSSTGIQFFGIQILSKLTDIIFNKPISLGLSDKLHYNVCNCPDKNRIILHQFLTNKVFAFFQYLFPIIPGIKIRVNYAINWHQNQNCY